MTSKEDSSAGRLVLRGAGFKQENTRDKARTRAWEHFRLSGKKTNQYS